MSLYAKIRMVVMARLTAIPVASPVAQPVVTVCRAAANSDDLPDKYRAESNVAQGKSGARMQLEPSIEPMLPPRH
jgi:hypothetical protein